MQLILSKVNEIDAVKDAMLMVEAYHHLNKRDALLSRIKYLVRASQVNKAVNLINMGHEECLSPVIDLDIREKNAICTNVMFWLMELIEYSYKKDPNNWLTKNMNWMDSLLAFAEILHEIDRSKKYFGLQLFDISNMVYIAKKYDIVVTAAEYRSEAYKLDLLKSFILKIFAGESSKGLSGNQNADIVQYGDLDSYFFRFSHLLGIDEKPMKGTIAVEALKFGDVNTCLMITNVAFNN